MICKSEKIERVLCKNISGIDHTTIIEGGIIKYELFNDGSAKIDKIKTNLFKKYRIIMWDSGIKKNTSKAIKVVNSVK